MEATNFPPALAPLLSYNQFIVYRLDPDPADAAHSLKRPIDYRTGRVPLKGAGGAHDPEIWTDAARALQVARHMGRNYGVGFVITEDDPFFLIDIDSCLDTATQQWSPIAAWLVNHFAGAAVEVSASGRGLHIIGSGVAPLHRCKSSRGYDLYTQRRFIALTGTHASGSAGTRHDAALASLVAADADLQPIEGLLPRDWTDEAEADYGGPVDDAELLRRAMNSRGSADAAFGNVATFAQLWDADAATLGRLYPDDQGRQGRAYDASRVDAALAQHLAFWTGRNCERMLGLMHQSALRRDKWDARPEYLETTILNAVNLCTEWLRKKPAAAPAPPGAPGSPAPEAPDAPEPFCSVQRQMELFAGCCYVFSEHGVMVPGGTVLKPEQFRVKFGGYSFQMEPTNTRISRNAFEAFTESQLHSFPRADRTAFYPTEEPGALMHRNGQVLVNSWVPPVIERRPGDVTRLTDHLKKLVPDQEDRDILWAYFAALVQYPGVKFQWCPVLQGIPGNGKSLFTFCVAEAVGWQYVHLPRAQEFAENRFNGWLYGNLLIGVEDVYVPERKADVFEAIKPMITGSRLEIEDKGVKKFTREVWANFILNCNRRDGIRKVEDDRRFAIFYTAQQNAGDDLRDGITPEYMHGLHSWLKQHGGYAVVSEFLHTYKIPDALNPALGWKAPLTSSTNEAIEEGRGRLEQEILEKIAQGSPGFANGWVSSAALAILAKELRIPLAPIRMRAVMSSLGYIPHPMLVNGRATTPVMPDGVKCVLYIKNHHPAMMIKEPSLIAQRYSDAQMRDLLIPMAGKATA